MSKQPFNLRSAVIAGTAAGLVSGLVKLGWENLLPPRSPERDSTNPPQQLLQQLGVPAKLTHATYTYSGHQMPYVSFIMHFGFSTTFAVMYQVAAHKLPAIKAGHGTVFGLGVWGVYHLGILPALGTIPSPSEQPMTEHFSEALGHAVWMWTNDVVGDAVEHQLNHR